MSPSKLFQSPPKLPFSEAEAARYQAATAPVMAGGFDAKDGKIVNVYRGL